MRLLRPRNGLNNMTEPTNHADEARRFVADIAESIKPLRDRNDIPVGLMNALNGNAIRDLLSAHVHATLALVEQQAIANRIALAVAILHEGNGVLGYFSEAEQEALGL